MLELLRPDLLLAYPRGKEPGSSPATRLSVAAARSLGMPGRGRPAVLAYDPLNISEEVVQV